MGRSESPSQYTRVNHVTFEDVEPEPFVWKGGAHAHESDDEDEYVKPEDRKWEEFELPDSPEYASEAKDTATDKQPTSGYIPIDLSQIPPEMFGRDSNSSMSSESVKSAAECKEWRPEPPPKPPATRPVKVSSPTPCESCGKQSCAGTPVHVLTPEEVNKQLGAQVAKHIVTELALRSGNPAPFPPRDPKETAPYLLSIRDKPVIRTYAMWGSIFMFQKLILSILRSLDKFNPSHEGAIQLEYDVASPKVSS
jgi:hypothetical protein